MGWAMLYKDCIYKGGRAHVQARLRSRDIFILHTNMFLCVCMCGRGGLGFCVWTSGRVWFCVHELYVNIFTNTYIIYIHSNDLGDFLGPGKTIKLVHSA